MKTIASTLIALSLLVGMSATAGATFKPGPVDTKKVFQDMATP